jgi:pantoate--beta-alanine ligase
MEIIKSINALQAKLSNYRKANQSIGMVPTMGALHEGHIQLVKRCVDKNDICVTSIFVNPTQFNDPKDLTTYPRTPEEDSKMLKEAGCDIIFMPEVEEMYPEPDTRIFNFGNLEMVMEGRFRPGHFNGVAQIVSKLFDAVMPDKAYFGEKDFQQLAIIREMVKQLNYKIQIVPCPIVREKDGLAMSSRNRRLTIEEREKAPLIAEYLFKSLTFAGQNNVKDTEDFVKTGLNAQPIFKLEYFEIVDGNTLQSVNNWNDSDYIVGCLAVFCGPVRLIDNIVYKNAY